MENELKPTLHLNKRILYLVLGILVGAGAVWGYLSTTGQIFKKALPQEQFSASNVLNSDIRVTEDAVIRDGKSCYIKAQVTNPYDMAEQVIITECGNSEGYLSVFLLKNGAAHLLENGGLYFSFADWNSAEHPPQSHIKFLNTDELLYDAGFGEGAACGSAGSQAVYKLNIRSGVSAQVSETTYSGHCHITTAAPDYEGNDRDCWDGTMTFLFQNKKLIEFTDTCMKDFTPSDKIFRAIYNGKTVLEKTFSDSQIADTIYRFSLIENTYDLLQGRTVLTFSTAVDNKQYSLDLTTGKVEDIGTL